MKKRLLIFSVSAIILVIVFLVFSGYLKGLLISAVDKAISENVDAQVIWNHDQFSISFFQDFPSVTAVMEDIGVLNNTPFEDEVLFVADEFHVSVDLWSLLGSSVKIKGISLVKPIIHVKINEAGEANYNIVKESGEQTASSTTSESEVSIDHWEIISGTIIYEDLQSSTMLELHHVDHKGSGNFNQEQVNVSIQVESDSVYFAQSNITYLSNKVVAMNLEVSILDDFTRFVLGENSMRVNEFIVNATGEIGLIQDEGYSVKLNISTPENEFKNLLSIVPGVYSENFGSIQTDGRFSFAADINGDYTKRSIPSFLVKLEAKDAAFQYDGMAVGVENIQLDVMAQNNTGILEDTRIELNELSMQVGSHKAESRIIVENLRDYAVDGMAKLHVDLGELTAILPMDNLTLEGFSKLDLSIKGTYDSVKKVMPVLDGSLILEDVFVEDRNSGYIMSDINLTSLIKNETGRFTDLGITIPGLSFTFEDQPVSIDGTLANLENISWSLNAQGQLDLFKMLSLFNLTEYGVEAGELKFDIHTRGQMADLEKQRYAQLPTSGEVQFTGFRYSDDDMPAPLEIRNSQVDFTPSYLSLEKFDGALGKSDFQVNGRVNNYMDYLFNESEELQANLVLNSQSLDLDEFMNAEYSGDSITASTNDEFRIPGNLDISMDARVARVVVNGIGLKNFSGEARIAEEKVFLTNISFETLGGLVTGEGVYQTQQLPASIDMNLKAENMDIARTAESIEFTRKFMPVLGVINGSYSTNLKLSGDLKKDLSLDLSSIDSDALVQSSATTFEPSKLTNKFAELSGFAGATFRELEEVMMHVTIRDGNLYVEPFDVKIGKYKAEVFGTNGLDGSMAYEMTVFMPAGELGQKLNSFINDNDINKEEVPVTFGIGGTWSEPEVALLKNEQQEAIAEAIKQKAAGEVEQKAKELVEEVKDENTRALLTTILGGKDKSDSVKTAEQDSTKTTGQDSTRTDASELKEKALDEVKNFFKKKKKKDNE